MSEQATCGCGKMTLAANERMGTLAGGATVKKAFCFDCLTLLESDGETVTVTRLVRAVTPEAVKATWLFRLLDYAAKHNPFDPEKVTHLDVFGEEMPEAYPQYDSEIWSFGDVALVHIHWGDYDEPLIVAIEGLTEQGRTIHAALQQAREPGEPTADEREPVRWFAGLMETTLRKHDAERGEYGWRDGCDEEYLVERLQDEVRELVREFNPCMLLTQAERVIAECADIGNFAMMLADQHRAIIAQRGGKE